MNTQDQALKQVNTEDIRALLAEQLLAEALADCPLPVSSAQQRLWFLDQLEPNTSRYNIPCVVWLTGKLNTDVLEEALKTIVERHESLRARFISEDGQPAQVIDPPESFRLRKEDLSALPGPSRELTAKRIIQEESGRPFQLSEGRLMRATLLLINPEENVLIINMHHIISDEWSFKVFFHELEMSYGCMMQGLPVTLPELPIRYTDYAAWQNEWMESEEYQQQLQFWKETLAGNPRAVELPTDLPRSAHRTQQAGSSVRFLGRSLTERIKELASHQKTTPFILLLSAFKTLLYKQTGSGDIIVGSPIAGRRHLETEPIIGFFANTLPLRTCVSGDLSFTALISRVREGALGAYSNQDIPFDKLVEALQPDRVPGQTPYIRVLFIFQSDAGFIQLPGVTTTILDPGSHTAKFDITLFVADADDGMVAEVEYDLTLFKPQTIDRLLAQFEGILLYALRHPESSLDAIAAAIDQHTPKPSTRPIPEFGQLPRWDYLDNWFSFRLNRATA